MLTMDAASALPVDADAATLVGRVWLPAARGPSVVVVRSGEVFDVTAEFATVSGLADQPAVTQRT